MEPISALVAALVASPPLLASVAAALGLGGLAVALQLSSLDPADPASVIAHMNVVAAEARKQGVDAKIVTAACVTPQNTINDIAMAGYFDEKIGARLYEKCAGIIAAKAE